MYFLTRRQADGFDQFLDVTTRKWRDTFEETQGYKTLKGAQNKFHSISIAYKDYYGAQRWEEKMQAKFLSISFDGPTQRLYNLKVGE